MGSPMTLLTISALFLLHSAKYWKLYLIWGPAGLIDLAKDGGAAGSGKGEPLSFVSEHLLSFGITISSKAAQRPTELHLAIFRRRFGREERACLARILEPKHGHLRRGERARRGHPAGRRAPAHRCLPVDCAASNARASHRAQ